MERPLRRARIAPYAALLLAGSFLAGCEHRTEPRDTPETAAAAPAWIRTECYLGMNIPGGGQVSAAEWQAFLDSEVTPRFREGLTVFEASGQYLGQDGKLVREPTKVLLVLHPDGAEHRARVDAVAAAYKKRFKQESVLIVRTRAQVSF
ncbi:MAG: DUF3574 domain-containing protein [Planctomycetes bacterium]|nr:DUF3574 domain-containing protein [Planctomycetota bacterium]